MYENGVFYNRRHRFLTVTRCKGEINQNQVLEQLTEKFILDATAGYRMMWTNKQHPNAIYLDEKAEVCPDIIGDFTKLSQFPDNTFRLVLFDPPHVVRNSVHGDIQRNFGILKCETWQSDLRKGLIECMRVLKTYGILLFKWNTHSKTIPQILKILPYEPLVSQTTKGTYTNRRKHESRTVWFCFMKLPVALNKTNLIENKEVL